MTKPNIKLLIFKKMTSLQLVFPILAESITKQPRHNDFPTNLLCSNGIFILLIILSSLFSNYIVKNKILQKQQ